MTALTFHRALGWLESYTVDISAVVIGVCELESSKQFDKQRLELALHQCIDRHHNLRLNINSATKPYRFYFVTQPYSTPTYIEFESKDEWQNIVNEELNTPFEIGSEQTSLFKLIVLYHKNSANSQRFLLIKYHHAVGDGISGMIILNTLLSYYFIKNPFPSILPHLCDNETLAFPKVTDKDERKTEEMVQEVLAYKRKWTSTIPYEVARDRNSISYFHGTTENMVKLLDRCHQEKVTIGSVLLASIYFAVAELVKDTWLHQTSSCLSNFKFDLDVNLRHRYSSPFPRHEHVGLHVGMMTLSNIAVSLQTKFWSLCHIVHKELQNNLADDKHLIYLRANRLCSNDKQIEEQTNRNDGRTNDLNFSNIGPYPFQQEFEEVKLKHYYCVASNCCPTVGTNILLVCSINSLDYALLHEAGEKNQSIAKHWFERVTNLTDTAWKYGEDWTFDSFMKEKN